MNFKLVFLISIFFVLTILIQGCGLINTRIVNASKAGCIIETFEAGRISKDYYRVTCQDRGAL